MSVVILQFGGRRGRDCMVAGFIPTCAISAHHHLSCEFEPPLMERCIQYKIM